MYKLIADFVNIYVRSIRRCIDETDFIGSFFSFLSSADFSNGIPCNFDPFLDFLYFCFLLPLLSTIAFEISVKISDACIW